MHYELVHPLGYIINDMKSEQWLRGEETYEISEEGKEVLYDSKVIHDLYNYQMILFFIRYISFYGD